MKNLIFAMSVIMVTMVFNGCAVSDYLIENYQAGVSTDYRNTQVADRALAKEELKLTLENDLKKAYGERRGYYLVNRIVVDKNIKYRFAHGYYTAYVDQEIITKEIERSEKIFSKNRKPTSTEQIIINLKEYRDVVFK
jgi:hypothetical protein